MCGTESVSVENSFTTMVSGLGVGLAWVLLFQVGIEGTAEMALIYRFLQYFCSSQFCSAMGTPVSWMSR